MVSVHHCPTICEVIPFTELNVMSLSFEAYEQMEYCSFEKNNLFDLGWRISKTETKSKAKSDPWPLHASTWNSEMTRRFVTLILVLL